MTLLGLAIAVVAVAAGCGGSDSSAESAPASAQNVSRAEFLKQASAACREQRADVKERADRYLAFHKHEPNAERLYGFVHFILLPTIEAETTRVRHLPHPAEEETEISATLSSTELATDKVATLAKIRSLKEVYARFGEAEAQYRALGLLACANGPHFQRYNSIYQSAS